MKNPILDNRIVNNQTFAVRFLSFIKNVTINDAGSEEEKEMLLNIGNQLLKYQCITATDVNEIDYLKRMNVYNKNLQPLFITEDCIKINEGDDVVLYSCMKKVSVGEQILQHNAKIFNENRKPNVKRLYFVDREECKNQIHKVIK